jgi:hypothetical protein
MTDTTTSKKPTRKVESNHLKRDDHLRREQIRQEHITTAAYFKAQDRGFLHGMDMQDWLEAEAEYEAKRQK